MSERNDSKEFIGAYVEPELAEAMRQEASRLAVPVSSIIRWALRDRYPDRFPQSRIVNPDAITP